MARCQNIMPLVITSLSWKSVGAPGIQRGCQRLLELAEARDGRRSGGGWEVVEYASVRIIRYIDITPCTKFPPEWHNLWHSELGALLKAHGVIDVHHLSSVLHAASGDEVC